MITIGELFAGIGGFSLAFHAAGARTRSERAVRPNKDTGLYGVVPTPNGRYRVTFSTGLRVHTVGTFDTPDEAARAHDAYVLREGLFRPLNFGERVGETTLGESA